MEYVNFVNGQCVRDLAAFNDVMKLLCVTSFLSSVVSLWLAGDLTCVRLFVFLGFNPKLINLNEFFNLAYNETQKNTLILQKNVIFYVMIVIPFDPYSIVLKLTQVIYHPQNTSIIPKSNY